MAETYTKLFNTIVTSSIWHEDPATCKVWVTMLAMADFNGCVYGSIIGLADMARVDVKVCEAALMKFKSPDKYSRSKMSNGRRIEEIEGGWKLINHEYYREKGGSRAEYYRVYRRRNKKKGATVARNEMQQSATHTETETETYSLTESILMSYWNSKKRLPKVRTFSKKRKAHFKTRLNDTFFVENWKTAVDKMDASDFCCGVNGGWRADIDFLIKNDNNIVKVIEGKYDNRETIKRKSETPRPKFR